MNKFKKFRVPITLRNFKVKQIDNLDKEWLLHRVKFSKMRPIQHRKYRRIVRRKWYRELDLVFA